MRTSLAKGLFVGALIVTGLARDGRAQADWVVASASLIVAVAALLVAVGALLVFLRLAKLLERWEERFRE